MLTSYFWENAVLNNNAEVAIKLCFIYIFLQAIFFIIQCTYNYVLSVCVKVIKTNTQNQILEKLKTFSFYEYDNSESFKSSDLLLMLTKKIDDVALYIKIFFNEIYGNIIFFILGFFFLDNINKNLSPFFLSYAFLVFLILNFSKKYFRELYKNSADNFENLISFCEGVSHDLNDSEKEFPEKNIDATPILLTVINFLSFLFFYFATMRNIETPKKDYFTLIAFSIILIYKVNIFSKNTFSFIGFMNLHRKLNDFFDIEPIIKDSADSFNSLENYKLAVEFKKVFFNYPNKNNKKNFALKDITFKINKGEIVGILGESDSGKSTILHLIKKFYLINGGLLLINGADLKFLRIKSLENLIGIIPQGAQIPKITAFKFDKKIKVFSVKKKFILNKISKPPKILLIDDLKNCLTVNDYKFLKSSEMTVIATSTNLEFLKNCDYIILLKDGKISCINNYEKLLKIIGIEVKHYDF